MNQYTHQIQGLSGQSLVERTAVSSPISWGYLAGSAISASAVGAGIGYLASGKSKKGLKPGAAAALAAWSVNSAVNEFFLDHKVLSAVLTAFGGCSLWFAWRQ